MTTTLQNQSVAWPTTPLGEIAEVKLGEMLDKAKHLTGRRMPYLRNVNVRWGSVDTSDLAEMYFQDDELDRFGLKTGDVLVCEGGEPGRAAVWNNSIPNMKYQKAIHRIRFKQPYEQRLFVYLLELLARTGRLERRFTGSTIKHFTREAIAQLPIPVPPLDEQQRIVAVIGKQLTRLDAGVASLTRVLAALKRHRASVLNAACDGRLVATEAELARKENRGYETGEQLLYRIVKARRNQWNGKGRYKEPASIEPGHLPIVPEGWTLASAEAICSSVRDGTHDTPAYVREGVPLITSKNLLPTGLDFRNVKLISRESHLEIGKRSGVERGDILFAMIGTIGNPVVVETDREFSIKNVGLFKANAQFILPRYLRYWFMSPQFTRWLGPKEKGTTQKFVPLGLMRSLVVALPPLPEQHRVVAAIEQRLSVIDGMEAAIEIDVQRTGRLRQAILQNAFTRGGVPND